MTAWIVVTVVSKSLTSWLIETFITDWSSTMRNCAVAKATSAAPALARRGVHHPPTCRPCSDSDRQTFDGPRGCTRAPRTARAGTCNSGRVIARLGAPLSVLIAAREIGSYAASK